MKYYILYIIGSLKSWYWINFDATPLRQCHILCRCLIESSLMYASKCVTSFSYYPPLIRKKFPIWIRLHGVLLARSRDLHLIAVAPDWSMKWRALRMGGNTVRTSFNACWCIPLYDAPCTTVDSDVATTSSCFVLFLLLDTWLHVPVVR